MGKLEKKVGKIAADNKPQNGKVKKADSKSKFSSAEKLENEDTTKKGVWSSAIERVEKLTARLIDNQIDYFVVDSCNQVAKELETKKHFAEAAQLRYLSYACRGVRVMYTSTKYGLKEKDCELGNIHHKVKSLNQFALVSKSELAYLRAAANAKFGNEIKQARKEEKIAAKEAEKQTAINAVLLEKAQLLVDNGLCADLETAKQMLGI